jgi:hypothetical protein
VVCYTTANRILATATPEEMAERLGRETTLSEILRPLEIAGPEGP